MRLWWGTCQCIVPYSSILSPSFAISVVIIASWTRHWEELQGLVWKGKWKAKRKCEPVGTGRGCKRQVSTKPARQERQGRQGQRACDKSVKVSLNSMTFSWEGAVIMFCKYASFSHLGNGKKEWISWKFMNVYKELLWGMSKTNGHHSKVSMSIVIHGHGTSRLVKVVERTPCAASGRWKNIRLDFQWINSGAMASEMRSTGSKGTQFGEGQFSQFSQFTATWPLNFSTHLTYPYI